jgi:hypothetical protein
MKYLLLLCLTFSLCFVACGEDDCHVDNAPAACADVVPTDELCLAAFETWFYDKATNTCEKIGYSGCNRVGFVTEVECLSCVCNED